MILFENVVKSYDGKRRAVNDVSLHVPEGETVVLLGPSGCGKTTILRMVNRLTSLSDGKIEVGKQNINDLNKIELRRNIGYVIQSNGLFPNMTIYQNVVAVLDLLKWSKEDKERRYNELMELIGMDAEEFRKRYPHELSGGQQQRIGIARALASNPPVMLMDEPFAALDPVIRTHLQNEFLQIMKAVKKTVLFVSHDIDEAIKMGDKIAIFKDGELLQYDEPVNILTSPNNDFIADFVGSDRTLKQLSLFTVRDLVDESNYNPITNGKVNGNVVKMNVNLRDTVSDLFNKGNKELIIVDEKDKRIGTITLDNIIQFLRADLSQKEIAN